jgi:hypothetical protein
VKLPACHLVGLGDRHHFGYAGEERHFVTEVRRYGAENPHHNAFNTVKNLGGESRPIFDTSFYMRQLFRSAVLGHYHNHFFVTFSIRDWYSQFNLPEWANVWAENHPTDWR